MSDTYCESGNDGSLDFWTESAILDPDNFTGIPIKYWDKDDCLQTIPGIIQTPRLVLVTVKEAHRMYPGYSRPAVVCDLQLMDGSECVGRAFTNTCLSRRFMQYDLQRGSTLLITDFSVLSFGPSGRFEKCMIINDCGWKYPPRWDEPDVRPLFDFFVNEDVTASINAKQETLSTRFFYKAINKNRRDFGILFTKKVTHQPEEYRWDTHAQVECKGVDFYRGDWIQDHLTCEKWRTTIRRLANEPPRQGCSSFVENRPPFGCPCVHEYSFHKCIVKMHNLLHVNKIDHLTCLHDHLPLEHPIQKCTVFDDLTNLQKRYFFCSYYATNVFQILKEDTFELPWCLQHHIEILFPLEQDDGMCEDDVEDDNKEDDEHIDENNELEEHHEDQDGGNGQPPEGQECMGEHNVNQDGGTKDAVYDAMEDVWCALSDSE